ncbi:MAG: hypothetical protein M3Z04_22630 [Chloroflexota bacterium]|nr:hypothetical protein [Chloroflexota bacterium]
MISDEALSLLYWQAAIAVGRTALDAVLREPYGARRYPDLIQRTQSTNVRTKNDTVIPGELLDAALRSDLCANEFYISEDGSRIYAVDLTLPWMAQRVADAGLTRIEGTVALRSYGAYPLFMAADNSYGYKGERDTRRALHTPRTFASDAQLQPRSCLA